ncbi:hypothetical protein [Desulfovibrio cuneatus]|uniref:hypothetical protein n=1 Tax=Desulfovibrio cuneatus TaxID=159728 RepID=UPI0003F6BE4A|nr:hypothetical protein [Desulfovibrio cuneatus]
MKIYAINYATDNFTLHQTVNAFTAKHIGKADTVISYGPQDLDTQFQNTHAEILSNKRGAGLWLWKPYVCLKTLEEMAEGDYLFYCDAGAYYVSSIRPLVTLLESLSTFLLPFTVCSPESMFTKRELFTMMGVDESIHACTHQVLAGYFLVKNCPEARSFFQEYLTVACMPGALDESTWQQQREDFRHHRHDQSIFSLLCKKKAILSYRDPSEWGEGGLSIFRGTPLANTRDVAVYNNVLNSPYPRIVELCRTGNPFVHRIKLWADKNLKKKSLFSE